MDIRLLLALAGLAFAGCAPDFRSNENQPPIRLSATDAARAMREDHYYSDHGTTPVLLTGVVRFVQTTSGAQHVAFDTSDLAGAQCRFTQPIHAPMRATITVLALDPARSGDSIVYRRCRLS